MLLLVERRDWAAAARLPLLLQNAGFAVDLYSRSGCIASHSRFVDRRFEAGIGDLDYFDQLAELLTARAGEWHWVVPVTDTDVRGVALRFREPWAANVLPARANRHVVQALLSKSAMDALLRRSGVAVPQSCTVESVEAAAEFASRLTGPIILKPVDGVAGGGVVLVEDPAGLEDAFVRIAARHPVIMAQEYVAGRIGLCPVVYQSGRPLAWLTAWKSRTWPGRFGPSSEVRITPIPSIERQLEAVGSALGFHGLLSLDFVEREDTGEAVIIEVNARPVGLMANAHLAGVDFPAALKAFAFGAPLSSHVAGTRRDVTLARFPQHLARSLSRGDIASLLGMLRPVALSDVPWSDPGLLAAQLRQVLREVGSA